MSNYFIHFSQSEISRKEKKNLASVFLYVYVFIVLRYETEILEKLAGITVTPVREELEVESNKINIGESEWMTS